MADGKVIWLRAAQRFGAPREVVAVAPGGAEEILLRGPEPRGSGSEQLGLLAAQGGIVAASLTDFVRTESSVSVGGSAVWGGPPRPELAPVVAADGRQMASGVAVADGQVLALIAPLKGRRRPRLVRWDPATGARTERRVARHTLFIAAAGRFVVTVTEHGRHDDTRVTVRDGRTWRLRTRVVVPIDITEIDVAVRPDGTLAVVHGMGRLKLGIARLGDRRLRRIRSVRPASYAVAFAGDGMVVARRTRRGTRLVRVTPGRRAEILTPAYRSIHRFAAGDGLVAWTTDETVYASAFERR